jgi:adenine phosphoribosyltransferase
MTTQQISNCIRVVPNFPKEGVYFRDISTLLTKPKLYKSAINMLIDMVRDVRIDVVAGVESRGFFLGMSIAERLDVPFIMLRKPNKMPDIIEVKYGLEYGSDVLTVQKNLITKGSHVLIVDDLIASGGSLIAGCKLIEKIGCHVAGCMCLMELVGITQLKEISNYKLFTLIKFPAHSENNYLSKADELLYSPTVKYLPINNISPTDTRAVVFCYPSMKSLANSIISCSEYFREGSIKWEYFADNYPHITYENLKYLINKRVIFFGSLYDRSAFSEQLAILSTLPKQTVKSLDIFIPYFAPGESTSSNFYNLDVSKNSDTLATAEAYAKMMANNLFATQDGLPRIHIFDMRSTETKSWFGDSAIVNLDTAIPLLKKKLDKETVTIVFPDAKTQERFLPQFKDFRSLCLSKYDMRIIQYNNWPSPGFDKNCFDDVLLVDDSVQTGDTFLECIEELKKIGAKRISLYATHPVFRNSSHNKFIFNIDIHKFYITNTIPEVSSKLDGISPFEVIKIDDLIMTNLIELFSLEPITGHQQKEYNIYVSSKNQVKLSATYDAISEVLKDSGKRHFKLNITGVNVSSDVSEQPINEETLLGCKNRFDNLRKYVEHHKLEYDILVSIENGMYYEGEINKDTIPRDHCQIIVMTKTNESTVKSERLSDKFTTFPIEFLVKSIGLNKEITVGKLIEKAYGYAEGTWHEHFGEKKPRSDIIKRTIISAFSETSGDLLQNDVNNM